ncbi:MAG: transglutaminase-like domain-containing protein [Fuerstiella sp.]
MCRHPEVPESLHARVAGRRLYACRAGRSETLLIPVWAAMVVVLSSFAEAQVPDTRPSGRPLPRMAASEAQAPAAADTWFVVRFDGKPVGYEHLSVQEVQEAGQQRVVLCRQNTRLQLRRLGQDLTTETSLSTRQTVDGVLLSFDLHRVDGGGHRTERSGEYVPAERTFRIREKVSATRRNFDLRVSEAVYSPIFNPWLPARAATSSHSVIVPMLFPESASVENISVRTTQNRRVRIGTARPVNARQIRFAPQSDPARSTTLFVDDGLNVLRQDRMLLGGDLSLEQATAETALQVVAERSLNLDVAAVIPVDRQLSATTTRRQLVLELSLTDGFLSDVPDTLFQKSERLTASSVRLTLTRPSLPKRTVRTASGFSRRPQTSTHWMPLENPLLQRMAATAAGGHTDPVEVCRRLEQFVHSKMRWSAFSTSIVPADEVAADLRGDCTEHAVLLGALMRVKGIPSRVAAGIVHTNRQFGFTGHMWTEALINGEWFPFDSTTGATGIGTTHIKLAHSELPPDLTSGVVLFLPVLDLVGRARIKVISEHQ